MIRVFDSTVYVILMYKIYADLIEKGLKTIDDVTLRFRAEIEGIKL